MWPVFIRYVSRTNNNISGAYNGLLQRRHRLFVKTVNRNIVKLSKFLLHIILDIFIDLVLQTLCRFQAIRSILDIIIDKNVKLITAILDIFQMALEG